jgi:uncharacterized membrane protein
VNIKKLPIHVHHIGSHFTNALFPVASVLLVAYFVTGKESYELAAFYSVIFGTLAVPVTYVSGGYDWKTRFQGRSTPLFTHKLIFGVVFLVLATAATLFRLLAPELATGGQGVVAYLYPGMIFGATGCAAYLGHLGSKFI